MDPIFILSSRGLGSQLYFLCTTDLRKIANDVQLYKLCHLPDVLACVSKIRAIVTEVQTWMSYDRLWFQSNRSNIIAISQRRWKFSVVNVNKQLFLLIIIGCMSKLSRHCTAVDVHCVSWRNTICFRVKIIVWKSIHHHNWMHFSCETEPKCLNSTY